MSANIDSKNRDGDLSVTYSISIKTSSTSRRPLTCCITTGPRLSKYPCLKPPPARHHRQSTTHLPVTYSTSVHVPCYASTVTRTLAPLSLSPSTHHHRRRSRSPSHHHLSPAIARKSRPRSRSISSTRPTTLSAITVTSPESFLALKRLDNTNFSQPIADSIHPNKPTSPAPPSYSALVRNWFHPNLTKLSKKTSPHNDNQSEYSEIRRHDSPSKRSLLFNLITTPVVEEPKKSHHRLHHSGCFGRRRKYDENETY